MHTILLTMFSFLFAPKTALSHEVYVLERETIESAIATTSPNPFGAYANNMPEFYFWGLVSFIVLSTILCAAAFHLFEKSTHSALFFLKRFAHPIVRVTVGLTLVVFGSYGILYGPELPLNEVFDVFSSPVAILLMLAGACMMAGLFVRSFALGAIAIYAYSIADAGPYILTYVNHLGAYAFLLVMGKGEWSISLFERARWKDLQNFLRAFRPFTFALLRMTFGASIMLAALYGKFFHSELALQVVHAYELTRYFPFEPLFIVLGAFIIEFLAGLMLFLGIAVRWSVLFLAFWLTLAHLSMNEAWWVHIILYGVAIAIFCHGYDKWSLEGRLLRRKGSEPVF